MVALNPQTFFSEKIPPLFYSNPVKENLDIDIHFLFPQNQELDLFQLFSVLLSFCPPFLNTWEYYFNCPKLNVCYFQREELTCEWAKWTHSEKK